MKPMIAIRSKRGPVSPRLDPAAPSYILWRILGCRRSLPLDIVPRVCPHDCPSACALEVKCINGAAAGGSEGLGRSPTRKMSSALSGSQLALRGCVRWERGFADDEPAGGSPPLDYRRVGAAGRGSTVGSPRSGAWRPGVGC